ncbi:MAG: acyl-CoA carboxylase subunit beta [Candidatus Krumholzibacteria bacterium]|nr:acyl-CoA carboxylase subunit beta [Candidatus Krumholzibacteria bacterium]
MKSKKEKIEELSKKREQALLGGGRERIGKIHETGRLTARERIHLLFDEGSFQEMGVFVTHRSTWPGMAEKKIVGDGVVCGQGTIEGRLTYAYAQDFTVFGGSLSESNAGKIIRLMDIALDNGAPVVGLSDSGGARIQEGVASLAGYASIFLRNTLASGVVPQISAIMGPSAGGAVYSPALTDFIFMVEGTSHMFITGPGVIKKVTHEDVTQEDLGGARTHNTKSGVAHFLAADDEECIEKIRRLLSFLPNNNLEDPPYIHPTDDPLRMDPRLNDIVPDSAKDPYDIKEVIKMIVDDGIFFEVQELFAMNLVIGYARLNGHVIGIVANQPNHLAGVLDIESSVKGARFIRFCDAFNIPLVTFEDVPGFLPGTDQEWHGIIKHGAKLIFAYCEATVPKLTVITRKAYGGAYCVMSSKHIRSDYNVAWPTAELAVMGAEGAADILYGKEIEAAEDPDAERQRRIEHYADTFENPYVAAGLGYLDDVIMPDNTRPMLIHALENLLNKRQQLPPKKHGNIPL